MKQVCEHHVRAPRDRSLSWAGTVYVATDDKMCGILAYRNLCFVIRRATLLKSTPTSSKDAVQNRTAAV